MKSYPVSFITDKLKDARLSIKLTLIFATSSGLIFGAAFFYNYIMFTELVLRDAQEKSSIFARSVAGRFMSETERVSRFVRDRAANLEESGAMGDINRFVRDNIAFDADIYGSTAAFEPNAGRIGQYYFAPYFYRRAGVITGKMLGGRSYDYFAMDWYRMPKELNRPVWCEPYFDTGGGETTMITYSVPFYLGRGPGRRFQGVLTADISLHWLHYYLDSLRPFKVGYAFILSRKGIYITHPDDRLIMSGNIFNIAARHHDDTLSSIGKAMTAGKTGFRAVRDFHTGRDSYVYYTPLLNTGWSLGIVVPAVILFADQRRMLTVIAAIGIAGFIIMTLAIVVIARSIARPVGALATATRLIAQGNLDTPLPAVASGDEIGQLAISFDNMRVSLKEYIANLEETTAARERLEFELKLARDIQADFLPLPIDPSLRTQFDLTAMMEPAREVGGDLYEHIIAENGRLTVLVGDVSGKGVPASLYMAVTVTLFKEIISALPSPSGIITRLNRNLCIDNKSHMFVSAFCATLDPDTGELAFANAGHNPPVVISGTGKARFLDVPGNPAMGIVPSVVYEERSMTMKPGDAVLIYTDGITEAMDVRKEQYSDERLLATASATVFSDASGLVRAVRGDVKRFTGDAPQSDDITLMALIYRK